MDPDPCSSNLQKEDIFLRIRDKLRKTNVKLWLPPYYNEPTGPSLNDLKVSIYFLPTIF